MRNPYHHSPSNRQAKLIVKNLFHLTDPANLMSLCCYVGNLKNVRAINRIWSATSLYLGSFSFVRKDIKTYLSLKGAGIGEGNKFEVLIPFMGCTSISKGFFEFLANHFSSNKTSWNGIYRNNPILHLAVLSNTKTVFNDQNIEPNTIQVDHLNYQAARKLLNYTLKYTNHKITLFDIIIAKDAIRLLYLEKWIHKIGRGIAIISTGIALSYIFFWIATLAVGSGVSAPLCWGLSSAFLAFTDPFEDNKDRFGDKSRIYALITCFSCSLISSAWVVPSSALIQQCLAEAFGMEFVNNWWYLLANTGVVCLASMLTEAIVGSSVHKVLKTVTETAIEALRSSKDYLAEYKDA